MKLLTTASLSLILWVPGLALQNAADQPATAADVYRYLEATHAKELMGKTIQVMAQPMHQMIHENYMKDKDRLPPDFEERMQKIMDEMLGNIPWDEVLKAMVPVYQKHLTKGDVDNLVAFYSSPTGQKMLREMPAIAADSMNVTVPLMQKHMEEITRRMQQEIDGMVKASSPARN